MGGMAGRFGFAFLDSLYHQLGQPGEREFARRLGTYYQKIAAWRKGSVRIRGAFKILVNARRLSGKRWEQFGKELDEEFR